MVFPSLFTFPRGQAQTVTITPAFLIRTLNTGTAVVLQASNDITVDDSITVSAGGQGGALTLQAGRILLLYASITTNNGALTLIANDTLASGVVDAQRDHGQAVIAMADGTVLDTGSGTLSVQLRDGAGLINRDSGAITLQNVTAGSLSVANNGPSAGSDIILALITTAGSQTYTNPNGGIQLTNDVLSTSGPVTFNHSVEVNDGVTVYAGTGTVNFAGSETQLLQCGVGAVFVTLNHTGSGILQLITPLTITDTLTNSAGTFDANDQAVSVSGSVRVLAGTYLTGTGVQDFDLLISGGVVTSSTGPMTIGGAVTLAGGQLIGVGTVGALSATAGTLAPPAGILTTSGAITLNGSTQLSVTLNSTDPSTGYTQLVASGPVDITGSTLNLVLGFTPDVGTAFSVITTSDTSPITGTFAGLAEGATITTPDGSVFQITYQGGTGNSVVLTRIA
jgi:hypothetical protein